MPLPPPLPPVIKVDNARCVNCYACVTACPVKYCVDGSGDELRIRPDLCVGCGHCITACRHHARLIQDDAAAFFAALARREPVVAVVAPSAAAAFPGAARGLIGWLKASGVDAVFDVSFGAELAVRSYVNYIRETNPAFVIAQPCPAIVTYLEIYHPELLRFLAPVDSPMGHLMKMIRAFYPQYAGHRIAAISPCVAKRREFDEIGLGDYNVTYLSIRRRLDETGVDLADCPPAEFDGPRAGRAVGFSTPGGLLATIDRDMPGIWRRTRVIEGVGAVFPYLNGLAGTLRDGAITHQARFLVDCLSCEKGCNGGPGTGIAEKPINELETAIQRRLDEREDGAVDQAALRRTLDAAVDRYWRPGLFTRTYQDRSASYTVREPDTVELSQVYASIGKHTERDIYDCTSCGYGSCRAMATAIFNHLNQPRNCHHYDLLLVKRSDELKRLSEELKAQRDEIAVMKDNLRAGIFLLDAALLVRPNYSPALERILGVAHIQGRSFPELLASSLDARGLAALRDYLGMVFDNVIDREVLEDANPIREFEYRVAGPGAGTGTVVTVTKNLRSAFALVTRPSAGGGEADGGAGGAVPGGAVLLGTLEDITVERGLERELAEAERERQDEMRSIFEVVRVEPEVLRDFIEDTDAEFEAVNGMLRDREQSEAAVVNGMYQAVHAIKSNALILGFDSFALKLQDLESKIKEALATPSVPADAIPGLTVELERMMRERDKINGALERITSFAARNAAARSAAAAGGARERVLAESLRLTCERAAEDTGRLARFVITRLDGEALDKGSRRAVKEMLIQLIRNAVFHGIEPPAERRALGKSETGVVTCAVEAAGDVVVIRLGDDGRGLDVERIRERAVERGLIPPGDDAAADRVLPLIFSPQFSTAPESGFQAGRGVGLSLVRDQVRRLGGSIKVRSAPGRGAEFEMTVRRSAS